MPISVEYSPHLGVEFVEAAKKGLAAQAEQSVQKRDARCPWTRKVAQTPSAGLDVRIQQAVQNGIESRRKCAEEEKAWDREERLKAKQLTEWLHKVEATEAVPIMRAIGKAEKVSGYRLMLPVGNDFGLSSRGFRVAWPMPSAPDLLPDYTTSRLKGGRGWWGLTNINQTRQQVEELLKHPNLEQDLVYQGVDEWPTIGKICFWGIFLVFPPLGIAIWATQHAAHRRAFSSAVSQTALPPT